MMELGRHGVWYAADKLSPAQWRELVAHVETLGYDSLWYSEARGFESMALASFLLANSTRLKVGSSIANIYARDAMTSRQGLLTLSALSGDRFILGLGVSHVPMVETLRGHTYGKPVATMRAYLQQMFSGHDDHERWPLALAALGPRMLDLAGAMTRGALPYNVTPEHTARAKDTLGDQKWLVVEQKVCLAREPGKARRLAREELERYMGLSNYRNNWLSLGFAESDLEHGGSDRFLDAMVAWGGVQALRERIAEHFAAGATQVCIQPVHEAGDLVAAKHTLEALAPS